MATTRPLAILHFDDVEVLDFCGPFEVFSVANRITNPPGFNVLTVAATVGPVLTRGGLNVNPHHRLPDCSRPDLLLVPDVRVLYKLDRAAYVGGRSVNSFLGGTQCASR